MNRPLVIRGEEADIARQTTEYNSVGNFKLDYQWKPGEKRKKNIGK